jgi:hypothetical protein
MTALYEGEGKALDNGTLYPPGSNLDTELLARLTGYKKSVARRYFGLRDNEIDKLPHGSLHVSPKIDGELWFMAMRDGAPVLVAPNGRVLVGQLPLLVEAAKTFGTRAAEGTLVAGELFVISPSGRPRVGDVGLTLSGNGELKRLGFAPFDLLSLGSEDGAEAYADRLEALDELYAGGKRCKVVRTEVLKGEAEVRARYDDWVASGKAEGLVARAEDGRVYKIKPAFHLDCAVVGYTEKIEEPGLARSLLLALVRPDGTFQIVGSVGAIGDEEQRRALHQRLAGTEVASTFRRVSSSGSLYRLTRPEFVVEVITTDLIAEDSSSSPVRQWALRLDGEAGWMQVCQVLGASLLHPKLERIRDDKSVNATDVRVAQLEERTIVEGLDVVAETTELPESEIVRREVYTKTTKGQLAVRKLLVWRTNKADVDADYPAWVVHFTDYSAGRKSPLAREVKLAPDEAAAMALADDLIASKIKRGWERVDA